MTKPVGRSLPRIPNPLASLGALPKGDTMPKETLLHGFTRRLGPGKPDLWREAHVPMPGGLML